MKVKELIRALQALTEQEKEYEVKDCLDDVVVRLSVDDNYREVTLES